MSEYNPKDYGTDTIRIAALQLILVDTNVWVNHFNDTDAELVTNLNIGSVACHPYIIGEVAKAKADTQSL